MTPAICPAPGLLLTDTVVGTSFETFTDSAGNFHLEGLTVGSTTLKVFFTGFEPRIVGVEVSPGTPTPREITLGETRPPSAAASGEVLKLDRFVIASTREMEGAAIAINDQRFAPNTKNVASTDEYGNVAEGNPAEFLKFLPGITIEIGRAHV